MNKYLLDTNACIAIINDWPQAVRRRLGDALAAGATIAVPTIAVFELWFLVALPKGPLETYLGY